jgi:exodeoxyribonuclease VII small subunit
MPTAAPDPEASPAETSGASAEAPSSSARTTASRASGKRGRAKPAESNKPDEPDEPRDPAGTGEDLTFRQAQAALELCLAQLQASDLDVEAMGELHRRAEAYAQRCEQLLEQAEQDVMQWDPIHPDAPPGPLAP